ncbi:TolB family protein [Streptomyces roseifaciens]|uniref:TolB family protein n=1 Tax=Streptomyces roseifaciens TaxID=1488406 RepID=UPI000A868BBC|nr:PD40 domain-containing protein [Streptomyces roseifaciens]
MRHLRRAVVAAAVAGTCAALLPAAGAASAAAPRPAPRIERVSVASDGTQADAESHGASLSADGRTVVFLSRAGTLAPGAGPTGHVFVRDLQTGRTELISAASDGTPADTWSSSPSISGDGRYVVFDSGADLAPGSNPNGSDVFVRDRRTGRTEVLVANRTGGSGSNHSAAISTSGRYVAFVSGRDDLVPGDTNQREDVFVLDRRRGTTQRVSVASDGTEADGMSGHPVISADGSRIGFRTAARNLAPQTAGKPEKPGSRKSAGELARPGLYGFYVHELRTGRTERAAETYDGLQALVTGGTGLSPDGRYALFSSPEQVVADDTNGAQDVYAKDLRTGTTRRLSLAADGSQADGASYGGAAMSVDNERVFFASDAGNLVPGDTNDRQDVFVRNLRTGAVERLNVAADGTQDDGNAGEVRTDLLGRTAVFNSWGGNLVPGDTNGTGDVFVRRLGSGSAEARLIRRPGRTPGRRCGPVS